MKVLHINCVYKKGSTGKIIYDLEQYNDINNKMNNNMNLNMKIDVDVLVLSKTISISKNNSSLVSRKNKYYKLLENRKLKRKKLLIESQK